MNRQTGRPHREPTPVRVRATALALFLAVVTAGAGGGCAAVTNPVAQGVPVDRLPPEFLAPPHEGQCTIPLSCLSQPRPAAYRLGPGDVLGIWVEGILGEPRLNPPVYANVPALVQEIRRLPPAAGIPIPVRETGTITLPEIGSVLVDGMTLGEAEELVKKLYVQKGTFKPGEERILVTLLQPRQVHVVIVRQEAGTFEQRPEGPAPTSKQGTAIAIDLIAYENDVLHALARSGGLPGLDAINEIIIQRGCWGKGACVPPVAPGSLPPRLEAGRQVVRIPVRLPPGAPLPFGPEDVILHDGDVVFVENRVCPVFYAGGLLPSGEYVLPRDYDLDVVEAVAKLRGPLVNGGFSPNNLSGALIARGLGGPSPSLLTVIRRTPGGGQVPIRVDLDKALCDARERIAVQPGDVLILQETPEQGLARWFSQAFANFNLVWTPLNTRNATGLIDLAAPDRIPERTGTIFSGQR